MMATHSRYHGRPGWPLLVLAVLIAGCSHSQPFDRMARRRVPMPPPPTTSIEPRSGSEIPLSLPPAASVPGRQIGSAYGPSPGVSVAPEGSTGFSQDIRQPQSRTPRARAIPIGPRNGAAAAPPASVAPKAPAARGEIPLTVPVSPKRNGQARPPAAAEKQAAPPAKPDTRAAAEEAPGIPRYTVAEPNVATGGQPTLDGMKWLKERGFHTVLNLLPDAEADPAEAAMVRQLGLEYLALPITAATINRESLEQFNQIVDDAKHRPLFIHDSTGSRTGALWYLHRVTVDKIPEDRARSQAARIGLKDADTELWLVIQRLLAEKK